MSIEAISPKSEQSAGVRTLVLLTLGSIACLISLAIFLAQANHRRQLGQTVDTLSMYVDALAPNVDQVLQSHRAVMRAVAKSIQVRSRQGLPTEDASELALLLSNTPVKDLFLFSPSGNLVSAIGADAAGRAPLPPNQAILDDARGTNVDGLIPGKKSLVSISEAMTGSDGIAQLLAISYVDFGSAFRSIDELRSVEKIAVALVTNDGRILYSLPTKFPIDSAQVRSQVLEAWASAKKTHILGNVISVSRPVADGDITLYVAEKVTDDTFTAGGDIAMYLLLALGIGTFYASAACFLQEQTRNAAATKDARLESSRFTGLLSALTDAVVVVDRNGTVREASDAWRRLFLGAGVLIHRSGTLVPFMPDTLIAKVDQVLDCTSDESAHWKGPIIGKDGRDRYYEAIILPSGRSAGREATVILSDITDQRNAERLAQIRAMTDPCTGLPTITAFQERLTETLADNRRHDAIAGVIAIHVEGDVREGAESSFWALMRARLDISATGAVVIGSNGANEIYLLLSEVMEPIDAHELARHVCTQFQQPVESKFGYVRLTARAGLALAPYDSETPVTLCSQALRAARSANAREPVRFFNDGLERQLQKFKQTASQLEAAVRECGIQLSFVPAPSAGTHASQVIVAIPRVVHRDRVYLLSRKAALIEEAMLADLMADSCITALSLQLAQLHEVNRQTRVVLPIFGDRLRDRAGFVKKLTEVARYAPEQVEVCVCWDESTHTEWAQGMASLIAELRLANVGTYINKFAGALGQLPLLTTLPLMGVILDESLFGETSSDQASFTLLTAISACCSALSLDSVACLAADSGTKSLVRRIGVSHIGYTDREYDSLHLAVEAAQAK